jgi:hypothetical protein
LNVLFGSALREVEASMAEGGGALPRYLEYVFLGVVREKIEYKLLAIEDDLERRKKEVKRTYSGNSKGDFRDAIDNIEYCRKALTELVDAVRESSPSAALEELFHERIGKGTDAGLDEALEQSLTFLYALRGRVGAMLKDVVQFIHECMAYRSLALTVDSRDRLCRVQEKILMRALHNDLRMPIIAPPRAVGIDLNWSRQERVRPVILNRNGMRMLEEFEPGAPRPADPGWKADFLQTARARWKGLAGRGGVDLGDWFEELRGEFPELSETPGLALWYLAQDWPQWTPAVMLEHLGDRWVPLGKGWMMAAAALIPVVHPV